MIFTKPPFEVDFTLDNTLMAPEGSMKPFLGEQIDSQEIADNQDLEEFAKGYEYLRVFPVVPLLGADFSVERDSELSSSLRDLLNWKLAPIVFEQIEVGTRPLRKYYFIHTSIGAPVDEATGQPMAIEIYAYLKEFCSNDESGPYERELAALFRRAEDANEPFLLLGHRIRPKYFEKKEHGHAYTKHELVAHMRFQISEAVYSNILYPNINGNICE